MLARTRREQAFFDQIVESDVSNISSRDWWESPGGQVRFVRRIEMLRQTISAQGGRPRVLLVGSGDGNWFSNLDLFAEVHAIDISTKTVESLRARLPVSLRSRVETGDAHATRFESSTFDFVVANSTLHHLDLELSLREFTRILKCNGSLIAAEPNMFNPQVWWMHQTARNREKYCLSPDEQAFGRRFIQKVLSDYFFDVSVSYFDFWHPTFGDSKNKNLVYRTLVALESLPLIRNFCGSLFIKARLPKPAS